MNFQGAGEMSFQGNKTCRCVLMSRRNQTLNKLHKTVYLHQIMDRRYKVKNYF